MSIDYYGAIKPETIRLFYEKVHKTAYCWMWTGWSKQQRVTPMFWFGGRSNNAVRFSFLIHHGYLNKGKQIRQKCKNKFCVNPEHLYERIKAVETVGPGYGHNRKLTAKQVRKIRRMLGKKIKQVLIAKEFGITPLLVYLIKSGKLYKNI